MGYREPDINRILTSLEFKEPDRVPVMELWITSNEVYEYVLGKEVISLLLLLGVRGIHPVEPTYNDIYALKKKWYGKIAFFGNIDVVLLTTGTKEEIKVEVKKHLDGLTEGGGYIIGSSTSIFKGIPLKKGF